MVDTIAVSCFKMCPLVNIHSRSLITLRDAHVEGYAARYLVTGSP